jgi:hypothetical protein
MKHQKFFIGLVAILLVAFISCNSNTSSDDATSSNDTIGETIQCLDKCIIVFRPDDKTVEQKLDEDEADEFAEVLSDHEEYANELKEFLKKKPDIRYIESKARYITVDNGTSKNKFDTRTKDYMFGVILSRPDTLPVIQHGIFTDLEYKYFMQQYFRK